MRYELAMSRFYFHLREGDKLITDDEGLDLPDLAAARREAEQAARELLAEAIKGKNEKVSEAIVIADEEGQPLFTFLLSAVLPKTLKK